MSTPPDDAQIIIEIIGTGVLRIRANGWSGDAARCAVEADHIHNLSDLLNSYSPDKLRYYWDVERPSFITRSGKEDLAVFESLWDRLEAALLASPTT